jgi:GDPmannose 4,6-dehydratase
VATGVTHSVQQLLETAFGYLGLDYRQYVSVEPGLLRPAEVHHLRGDYSKAKRELGWEPRVSFEQLIKMMVDEDMARLQNNPSAPVMKETML